MSEKALLHAENYTVTEKESSKKSDKVSEQQADSNGLTIEGMAMPFEKRSRNGVKYDTDSIKENAESMIGNSILFNHDEAEPIGHVTNVEIKEDGLYYEGDINPNRRESESLQRGDIPHVSIQAMVEEMEETAKTGKVAVSEFLELSAVTVPGFPETDVQAGEAVSIESFVDGDKKTEDSEEETKEETKVKEAFEFSPIPTHVLYQSKQDAMLRAKRLGLQDVHRHELEDGNDYWMAGSTHEEWQQAIQDNIESKESNEEGQTSKEPFAGYDDLNDCVSQNSDKSDPEAYCAAIKRKTEQSKELAEAVSDVDTQPTEEIAEIASEVLEKIDDTEFDNDDCGTRTGLERANQLENREELSADTINRMVSFFARHDGNQKVNDDVDTKWEDCGYVAWQLWGGDAGREWAERKQDEIEDAKNEILGDKPTMNEQLQEQMKEQLEDVAEDDFTGTVADMYEEVDASDAASLMEEFTFSSNPEPVVALMADIAGMTPADLMEVVEDAMEAGDMDDDEDDEMDEGDYSDDDEEDESEAFNKNQGDEQSSQGGNKTTMNSEELEQKIEKMQETIQEQQKMIEKLEDNESSKQETGTTSSESNSDSVLNPEFEDKMKNR